jgi:transposase
LRSSHRFKRRRRWTAAEKVRIVEETFEPGMTVSLVARRHGVAPNQLFTWVEGALTAAGSDEQVVPASDYRALQSQVHELQWLLGKKTLEAEILKEALEHATGSKKTAAAAAVAAEGQFPMTTVVEVIGVSRSNLMERMRARPKKRIGGGRCQTVNSWRRSRQSSPSCQPTATGVSTPSSSAKRWRLA